MPELTDVFDDAVLPIAMVRESALAHNLEMFADYCAQHRVALAPHVKTTMSPEIYERQRAAGAWGATVATPAQADRLRAWGERRILLATQVVDRGSLAWLIESGDGDSELEIYTWLDSSTGLMLIRREHERLDARRPVRTLIELGHRGGRTGVRSVNAAVELAEAASSSEWVEVWGVAAFEGTIALGPTAHREIERLVASVGQVVHELQDRGLLASSPAIVTIGGSAYFDRVIEGLRDLPREDATVILRSGCYVTHDCGIYDELSPLGSRGKNLLRSAIEVWGAVLSTPEPGLAIANIGKRHASFDAGMPRVTRILRNQRAAGSHSIEQAPEVTITELNDQHAYIRDPGRALAVGDLIGTCISHPCTTFDKWRRLVLVDDGYQRLGAITTEF
jgi:D-serine dehydratase